MVSRRTSIIGLLLTILTVPAIGVDTGGAILRNNGGVLLNGAAAPSSSAVFSGDTVQTQAKSAARIELEGSTIDVGPDTLIQFGSEEISLDHGSIVVNTSRSLKVRSGCVVVTPVYADWTLYDVTDTDGKVIVSAHRRDVNLDSRSSRLSEAKQQPTRTQAIVHEGEQKSREERCGGAPVESASRAAVGGFLDSTRAKWIALGVAGIIACRSLCQSDDPVSPSKP